MRKHGRYIRLSLLRGSRSEAHVGVVVELEEEDVKGIGECTPYHVMVKVMHSVMAQIMVLIPQLAENGLTREALQKLLPAGAARNNAVDSALWICRPASGSKSLIRAARRDAVPGFYYRAAVVIGTPEQMAASGGTMGKRGDVAEEIKLDARLIA